MTHGNATDSNNAQRGLIGRNAGVAALAVCFIGAGALLVTQSHSRQSGSKAVEPTERVVVGTPFVNDDTDGRGLVMNSGSATPGYVLFSPLLSGTTYLIDVDGQVVHTWESDHAPGAGLYLLDNGNLLRSARDPEITEFRSGGVGGLIEEFTWDGELVWKWGLGGEDRVLHHDIEPLPNGNVLALGWEVKSRVEAIDAGRRDDLTPDKGLWPDFVVEVEKTGLMEGVVVWQWHVWDHLVQNHDPTMKGFADPADWPHRLDINGDGEPRVVDDEELAQLKAIGYVPEDAEKDDLDADFLHINAVAYSPDHDQIALSVPELGEVWVVDHDTTVSEAKGRSGDLLFRWGNPKTYGRGTTEDQKLFYQHDVRWLRDPGTGRTHLTVFNNGGGRPEGDWSSVLEIELPIDEHGRYTLESGRPFGPSEPVWKYEAEERESFFAPFISGAERIQDAHTMICSGPDGRFFEIDQAGAIVWEYKNPFSGDLRLSDGTMPQPGLDSRPFATFRATKLPADHPALVGRDLIPLDPQPEFWVVQEHDVEE